MDGIVAPNLDTLVYEITRRVGRGMTDPSFLGVAESSDYSWDLSDSWMTLSNWHRVTNAYVDKQQLYDFIHGETDYLPTKAGHATATGTKAARKQWGGCIVGWSHNVESSTLHMHWRTTIAGFTLPLDVAIAHLLARELRVVNVALSIPQVQVHSFKSLPWFLQNEAPKHWPANVRRAYRRLEQLDREGVKYLDMGYAQECRTRRRYHAEWCEEGFGKQFEGGSGRSIKTVSGMAAEHLPARPVSRLTFDHLRK